MNKEAETILKKTVKVAGVTCVALGGAALIASGAALKAVTEGAKYLKDTVEKIVKEDAGTEEPVVEGAPEQAEEVTVAEAVAEPTDFAEAEPEPEEVVVTEAQA